MKKILLVDDEADFCFFLKKNLEARGEYEVLICTDGRQALATVKTHRPDLVILDILQPFITGGEIAEQMKADPVAAHIPFIFLTAVVKEAETIKHDDRIGGHYFIAKPVEAEKLIGIIEKVLQT
jgi:two-component system, sensor histidine kinase and response regulator